MAAKICFVLLVLCVVVSAGLAQHIAQKGNNMSCFDGKVYYAHGTEFPYHGRICSCYNGRHSCEEPQTPQPQTPPPPPAENLMSCFDGKVYYPHGTEFFYHGRICSCYNGLHSCEKPQTPQPQTPPPPPKGKLSIICKYKDQDFLRSLVPYMNDGRCTCDEDGIITCWTEPGSCVRYGHPYKHGETFEEYKYIDTITGFNRTDTCTCENEEVFCKLKSSYCYYNGVYSKHMSSYIFTSYYPEVRKFDCTCTNSIVECEKLRDCFINGNWIKNGETERKHIGFDIKSRMNRTEICTCTQGELNCIEEYYCFINGDWIKNGETERKYIGFDIKSRMNRTELCTCTQGELNCIEVPGSCFRNRRLIKHGETFEEYKGIDKISGFDRTNTCTCENEKIICKSEDAPCLYRGRYRKHGAEFSYGNQFTVTKCLCKNTKISCELFWISRVG